MRMVSVRVNWWMYIFDRRRLTEKDMKQVLDLLPDTLAVCRLASDAEYPEWVQAGSLTALVRTTDELSVICNEKYVPASVMSEGGWRCLKVRGPLEFSLVGVLASLVNPLASAGVSIFAVSTFETDYIMVKENQLKAAVQALEGVGFMVRNDASLLT